MEAGIIKTIGSKQPECVSARACECVCVSSASPSAVGPSAWAIGDHAFQSQRHSHWQPRPKQETKNGCWFYYHGTTGGCTPLFLLLTQAPAFSHSLTLFICGHTANTHTHTRTKATVKKTKNRKRFFFFFLSPTSGFQTSATQIALWHNVVCCGARTHKHTANTLAQTC